MVKRLIEKGKRIFTTPQTSILSAATTIMLMVVVSAVLGLVRERILLQHFVPEEFALFKAAFRFPDLFTGVLVLGSLSSAFIPVFTREHKRDTHKAWEMAGRLVNIEILVFLVFLVPFMIFTTGLYRMVTPGYSVSEVATIVRIARMLFLAQIFFVASYVFTGVLESLRLFFIPALAPVLYNVGIILGTVYLSGEYGLMGPVWGVMLGAGAHFLVQLPFVVKRGFVFRFSFKIDENVKKVGRLALPRMFELLALQGVRFGELFLNSLISTASYGYFTLAGSVQALPISVFGLSMAKAALPTLTRQVDDKEEFKKTVLATLYQTMFMVLPISTVLVVLRVPIVRLLFGTDIFDWEATVQTGLVLSAFAVGVPFQTVVIILSRAFYALGRTKTPVIVSVVGNLITVVLGFYLVRRYSVTWAIAAAFATGMIIQSTALYIMLGKRINGGLFNLLPILKSLFASVMAGGVMFLVLKSLDRSVWVKELSFLVKLNITRGLPFEAFVLDTRYTLNLLMLTTFVAVLGGLVYIIISATFRSEELVNIIKMFERRKFLPPKREPETLSPPASGLSE